MFVKLSIIVLCLISIGSFLFAPNFVQAVIPAPTITFTGGDDILQNGWVNV